jgi:D-alanine-D-alanine ligase
MKTKIALITGGYTDEAEISFKSADFVYSQLDHQRFEVYKVVISLGDWHCLLPNGEKLPLNISDFTVDLPAGKLKFDLAFVMLHGSPGEDGRLQGYFDLIGLPYTSCDALTASLTMNKAYTKAVLKGIPNLYMADSVQLFEVHRPQAESMVRGALSLPCFVKPNAGGSSIGMSKVNQWEELADALNLAFDAANTGKQVIVEEFVKGREFSVGIFRRRDGSLYVLPASEVITSREFFDYVAKYTPGLTQEITPADLNEEQRSRVEALVKEIYTRLNCKGMVRVDFFLEDHSDKFYFIEINTVPGQTAQSFIPQQVRAAGMKEQDFYTELIEVALNK